VHTTPGRDGVALWLPAGPGAPGPPPGYRQLLAAATAPWTGRFAVFDEVLENHHPADVPHQHLAILAVRPGCQGQGTGTALLTARHRDLDRDGVPAYLEASSPRPASYIYVTATPCTPTPRSGSRADRRSGPCGANRPRSASRAGNAAVNQEGFDQSSPSKPAFASAS
jgi:GNAT superfamily N-acetyltransferase